MLFVFRKYSLLGKPIRLTICIVPSQEYNLKLELFPSSLKWTVKKKAELVI